MAEHDRNPNLPRTFVDITATCIEDAHDLSEEAIIRSLQARARQIGVTPHRSEVQPVAEGETCRRPIVKTGISRDGEVLRQLEEETQKRELA